MLTDVTISTVADPDAQDIEAKPPEGHAGSIADEQAAPIAESRHHASTAKYSDDEELRDIADVAEVAVSDPLVDVAGSDSLVDVAGSDSLVDVAGSDSLADAAVADPLTDAPVIAVDAVDDVEPTTASESLAPDGEKVRRRLEALLFITSEPLSITRLAELSQASVEAATLAVNVLEAEYADRGIQVRLAAGGYRFATAPDVRDAVEAYLLPPKTSLSPAALETLAIVAYSQPVTKADIEQVRGVSVDGIVAGLVERGFVVEVGRKESAGRPILFGTTPGFLEAFGLPSLADLPPLPDEQFDQLTRETALAPVLEGTIDESDAERTDEAAALMPAEDSDMQTLLTAHAPNTATMEPIDPVPPIGSPDTIPEVGPIDPGSPMPPVDPQPNNPSPSMADRTVTALDEVNEASTKSEAYVEAVAEHARWN